MLAIPFHHDIELGGWGWWSMNQFSLKAFEMDLGHGEWWKEAFGPTGLNPFKRGGGGGGGGILV